MFRDGRISEEGRGADAEMPGEGGDVNSGELALAAEDAGGEGGADIEEAGEVGTGEGVGFHEVAEDIERAGGGRRGGGVVALPGFDEVAQEGEVIGLVAGEAMAGDGVGDGDGFAVVGAVADGAGGLGAGSWEQSSLAFWGSACSRARQASWACLICSGEMEEGSD